MSEHEHPVSGHDPATGDPAMEELATGETATGDPEVNAVLRAVDDALTSDDVDDAEALSEAHRRLQARLTAPATAPPGEARPGPR